MPPEIGTTAACSNDTFAGLIASRDGWATANWDHEPEPVVPYTSFTVARGKERLIFSSRLGGIGALPKETSVTDSSLTSCSPSWRGGGVSRMWNSVGEPNRKVSSWSRMRPRIWSRFTSGTG